MIKRTLLALSIGALISMRVDAVEEFRLSYKLVDGASMGFDISFFIVAHISKQEVILSLDFNRHNIIAYRSVGELGALPTITDGKHHDSTKPVSANTKQSAAGGRTTKALAANKKILKTRSISIQKTADLSEVNSRDGDANFQKEPSTSHQVADCPVAAFPDQNSQVASSWIIGDIATRTSEPTLNKIPQDFQQSIAVPCFPVLSDSFDSFHHTLGIGETYQHIPDFTYQPQYGFDCFDFSQIFGPDYDPYPSYEATNTDKNDIHTAQGKGGATISHMRKFSRHLSTLDEHDELHQISHESPSFVLDMQSSYMKVFSHFLQHGKPVDAMHRSLTPRTAQQIQLDENNVTLEYNDNITAHKIRLRLKKFVLVAGVVGLKGSDAGKFKGLPLILHSSMWKNFGKGKAYVCMQFLWNRDNEIGVLEAREIRDDKMNMVYSGIGSHDVHGLPNREVKSFLLHSTILYSESTTRKDALVFINSSTSWITFPPDVYHYIASHHNAYGSYVEAHGLPISCPYNNLKTLFTFSQCDGNGVLKPGINFTLTTNMYVREVNRQCHLRIQKGTKPGYIEFGTTIIKRLQPTFCYHQRLSTRVQLHLVNS